MTIPEFTTEELQSEVWKDVPEYEGIYAVSSLGRIKRTSASTHKPIGFILKPRSCDGRYAYCYLARPKEKPRQYLTHRVVAAAFIGPRPEGYEVNHTDANGFNNRPSNLEYVTPKENIRHAISLGIWQKTRVNIQPGYVPKPAYVAKGVWKHRLSDLDPITKTAVCKTCGPITVTRCGRNRRPRCPERNRRKSVA